VASEASLLERSPEWLERLTSALLRGASAVGRLRTWSFRSDRFQMLQPGLFPRIRL